jgi:hypothetical protein
MVSGKDEAFADVQRAAWEVAFESGKGGRL